MSPFLRTDMFSESLRLAGLAFRFRQPGKAGAFLGFRFHRMILSTPVFPYYGRAQRSSPGDQRLNDTILFRPRGAMLGRLGKGKPAGR